MMHIRLAGSSEGVPTGAVRTAWKFGILTRMRGPLVKNDRWAKDPVIHLSIRMGLELSSLLHAEKSKTGGQPCPFVLQRG